MKKITIMLFLLLLCGCQTKEKEPQTTKQANASPSASLKVKHLRDGDGNEDGFYHIASRSAEGSLYTNIYYYDYKTKEEIFLCDRPECTHMDKTCPSYVDGDAFTSFVFVNGHHLYLLQHSSQNQAMELIAMGLDGKHQRKIADLPENYELENADIAIGGNKLYLPICKIAFQPMKGGATLQVNADKKMIAVDLEHGKVETLIHMKNLKKQDLMFIGANQQQLVFRKNSYTQDPNEMLEKKDFDAYDQVTMHPTLSYITFDVNKKRFGRDVKSISQYTGVSYDDHIYEINEKGKLYSLSLQDGRHEIITSFPAGFDYTIADVRDHHVIIDAHEDTQPKAYSFDLQKKTQTEITLMTSEIKQRVKIMGESNDYFFVYYDHDEEEEISWAGTKQYHIKRYYYGLIKKSDYWKNKAVFLPVKMISQPL